MAQFMLNVLTDDLGTELGWDLQESIDPEQIMYWSWLWRTSHIELLGEEIDSRCRTI